MSNIVTSCIPPVLKLREGVAFTNMPSSNKIQAWYPTRNIKPGQSLSHVLNKLEGTWIIWKLGCHEGEIAQWRRDIQKSIIHIGAPARRLKNTSSTSTSETHIFCNTPSTEELNQYHLNSPHLKHPTQHSAMQRRRGNQDFKSQLKNTQVSVNGQIWHLDKCRLI